ncbi:MAG: cell division protein ZapA [Lachnospiraceae bacterium]|nr:cell division protein ZapA [Lachnospiraceae bacterium]
MNRKNGIEVIINGKRVSLGGYESEEYLQRVASYLNAKYKELQQMDSYRMLDSEMKNMYLQLNLADDYFKLKKQMDETTGDADAKSGEIFDLKHEVITAQTRLEAAQREIEVLKKENLEAQKRIIRLETELEGYHGKA